jgi:hypothetical protein
MGRVGSTTILQTLKNGLQLPVFQIHSLSKKGIAEANSYYRNNNIQRRLKGTYEILPVFIEKNFKSKKWKVISLVRDPVAREVSDFIKNGYDYFPNLMHLDGKPDIQKSLRPLRINFQGF